jgi:hypothetical protein
MWRRLIALTHPDRAGDDELFVCTRELHEHGCGDRIEDARSAAERRRPPPHPSTGERIAYAAAFDRAGSFGEFTERIAALADSGQLPERYAALLRVVRDCYEAHEGPLARQQSQGATYKTLAAIGHTVGMNGAERARWYEVCEAIPLSQRHAGHILGRLKRAAA